MESSSVSTQVKSEMATPQKRECEDMNVSEMSVCSTTTVHEVFIYRRSFPHEVRQDQSLCEVFPWPVH